MLKNIADFFFTNLPDAKSIALGGPLSLVWSAAALQFAGYLKIRKGLKTGYTRKIFHFITFGSVVFVNYVWGTKGVCLFGGMTSLVVAYAIIRGSGNMMYEAMAREKDAPRRTHYIIMPYFATLLGGLFGNIYFPATAVFGYLVTGLGDAVAEPVGTRFGKHEYRAPALSGVRAIRTIEGSSAVFAASLLTMTLCIIFSKQFDFTLYSFGIVILISFISTIVEAVSPHGWDNATLQIVPAILGTLWLL